MTHPDIAPLSFLLGTWRGAGHGDYPTIEAFDYLEEVIFEPLPKPALAYRQRTRRRGTDEPLHVEAGYVRFPDRRPELVICQPTGIVEAHHGRLDGQRLTWDSDHVGATPAAAIHAVTAVRRMVEVEGDTMRYQLSMAAVGHPLQVHLEATLERAEG